MELYDKLLSFVESIVDEVAGLKKQIRIMKKQWVNYQQEKGMLLRKKKN